MDRSIRWTKQILLFSAVCLILVTSYVPTAEAAASSTQYTRPTCWLLCS